jgi:flagellar hook-associated protein FlgK
LDTELANMLSIQKSYGASAQMMKAVDSMFTDLLNAVAASSS